MKIKLCKKHYYVNEQTLEILSVKSDSVLTSLRVPNSTLKITYKETKSHIIVVISGEDAHHPWFFISPHIAIEIK